MATKNDRLQEELDKLRATRDELRLQIHLGTAEARDRFEKLEKSWHRVEGHVKTLHAATEKDRARIAESARALAHEIAEGYRHLKTLL
jgi:cell division protein FtsB